MAKKRIRRTAAATGGVLALLAAAAGPGYASDDATTPPGPPEPSPDGSSTPNVQRLTGNDIKTLTIPAANTRALQKSKVDTYLEDQARSGRPTDVQNLSYVSADVPGFGALTAIVGAGERIDEVRVVSELDDNGDFHTYAGALVIPTDAPAAPAVPAGPGYDAGSTSGGVSLDSRACRPLWWDATYSGTDHYVYDCWEKYKSDSTHWAYNRYTLFDPAAGNQTWERGEIIDATIRTVPWRGHEWKVTGGPFTYHPHPTSSCQTYTASLSFQNGGISIPLMSCSGALSVFPRGDKHSMGTDWNGRTTGQVYLDYAFNITTREEPYYADYVWLEVQNCIDPVSCAPWNPSEYESWFDSGWWDPR